MLTVFFDSMLERLRLQLRRLRMRDTYFDYNYYYETYPRDKQKRYRLRRRVYSSPSLRRRYTSPSSSDTSDSDPENLYWIQSAKTRASTFTTHDPRSNFITLDMDRDRPRGFLRSLFASEYFDIFQRMKKETRPRYEEERPRPRQPRDSFTYIHPIDPRYRDEYRREGPRIDPPRRPPSPPLARPPRRRGVSLPRRVVRSRSPDPVLRPRSDELPRRYIHRPQESAYTRTRVPPARPPSPINERGHTRWGRYTSPFPRPAPTSRPGPGPSSRREVNIIQRNPRAISPQTGPYTSTCRTAPFSPHNAYFQTHNSIRERINRRKRIHPPEITSPPQSRKVRFVEGHEEISDPGYINSNSDSSSDSDSNSDSRSRCCPGSSRASIQSFTRSRSRPRVVVVQPQSESEARIVERRPGGEWSGVGLNGSVVSGPYQGQGRVRERVGSEGVIYEYREPRGHGRRRDYRRYV